MNGTQNSGVYVLLWTTANNLFSDLEDAHNLSPSADTMYPVAVAIARGGVSNTRWLASMGMLLLLAQQYYNHAQLRRETTK